MSRPSPDRQPSQRHWPSRDFPSAASASRDSCRRASASVGAHLAQLAGETRTLVFFEAPHRIAATLADLAAEFGGERRAVVARELTKAHETDLSRHIWRSWRRGPQVKTTFSAGEITIVVAGAPREAATGVDTALLRRAVDLLSKELSPGRAAAIAAQLTGATRSEAYALIQRQTKSPPKRLPRAPGRSRGRDGTCHTARSRESPERFAP